MQSLPAHPLTSGHRRIGSLAGSFQVARFDRPLASTHVGANANVGPVAIRDLGQHPEQRIRRLDARGDIAAIRLRSSYRLRDDKRGHCRDEVKVKNIAQHVVSDRSDTIAPDSKTGPERPVSTESSSPRSAPRRLPAIAAETVRTGASRARGERRRRPRPPLIRRRRPRRADHTPQARARGIPACRTHRWHRDHDLDRGALAVPITNWMQGGTSKMSQPSAHRSANTRAHSRRSY